MQQDGAAGAEEHQVALAVSVEVDRRDDAITVPVEAVVHRMRKDLPDPIVEAFDRKQATLDLSERVRQGQYIKVLYVKKDEAAEVRLIDPGIADTRRVEIREGVGMDDMVIVGPYRSLDQLEDGKKVALAEDEKKGPEEPGAEGESPDDELARNDEKDGDAKPSDDKANLTARTTP